jgi:hypothetical protein
MYKRKLIVSTAQGWFDDAVNPANSMSKRLSSMENALNHTENALAASEQRVDQAEARLSKTYTDDYGTVWTIPTAEAYALVCKARDKWQQAAEKEKSEKEKYINSYLHEVYEIMSPNGFINRLDQAEAQAAGMRLAMQNAIIMIEKADYDCEKIAEYLQSNMIGTASGIISERDRYREALEEIKNWCKDFDPSEGVQVQFVLNKAIAALDTCTERKTKGRENINGH